jgi:hypothetical protein
MADARPTGPRLPPFTYRDLVQFDAAQRPLTVHTLQQLLRRAAALFDYVDDVTLPIPGLGELVDVLAASPVLLAGALGAVEQLMRGNTRGAVIEVVGSVVEAAVTAIPGLELLDVATGLAQHKRTATLAREFVEGRLAGDTRRAGWWTTQAGDAYYIEPTGADYIVNQHGRADAVSPTPLGRWRYASDGSLAVWTPETNQWRPVTADPDRPTTRLP